MRIIYFIDSLGSGGAERQLVYLLERINRQKFAPIILTLHDNSVVPYHYAPAIEALDIPIYSLSMPFLNHNPLRWFTAIKLYIQFLRQMRPQVVHSLLFTSNLISRLGRLFTPYHTLVNTEQAMHYGTKRLLLERMTAFLCDMIIPNSNLVKKTLLKAGLPNNKMLLIPCSIPFEAFIDVTDHHFRKLHFPDVKVLSISAMRLHVLKGHRDIIQALILLKQRNLIPDGYMHIFIGDMHSHRALWNILQQEIVSNQLEHIIQWQDAVHDIVPYYHSADFLIHPSYAESFGLVIVEACAAGTPVIVNESANVLGIIRDDETGMTYPHGQIEKLAEAIYKMSSLSPQKRQTFITAARLEAKNYDTSDIVESHEALYERLSGAKSRERL